MNRVAGAAGGGIVHIKPGTYTISVGITDGGYSNIILEGEGAQSLIRCVSNFNSHMLYVGSQKWIVRNLSIDGTNMLSSTNNSVITVNTTSYVTISKCILTGGAIDSIDLAAASYFLIEGNTCLNAVNRNIEADIGSHDGVIIGNVCTGSSLRGNIQCDSSYNV